MRGSLEPPLFPELIRDDTLSGERIVDRGGDVRLFRRWLPPVEADALLASIRTTTVWKQERRKMYDRFVDVPREQASLGDDRDAPWTPELRAVRERLQRELGARFAFVLLNRYRDGADSVAWHNDHEVKGLAHPVVASLSLGATRAFDLRPKDDRKRVISIDLEQGDLLVMQGETQLFWEHRVAKDRRAGGERINLTFRQQPE